MTEWKTLRVPVDAYEEAKAQKEDEGRTWGQQIVRDSDKATTTESVDTTEIVEEIKNDLSMAADPGVDEAEIVDQVTGRIDDLEAELKRQIEALQR